MKLISIGKINTKFLIYTLIYLVIIVLLNIISSILSYFDVSNDNNLFLILICCHGSLIFFVVGECWLRKTIFNTNMEEKAKESDKNKNSIKYLFRKSESFNIKNFLILILMIILDYIYDGGLIYFQKVKSKESEVVFSEIFKFMDTLYLFIFFRVFHKIIFHKHQYISLIIIILMGLIKFFYKIMFNEQNFDFYLIGFIIFFPLIDSTNIYFFQKYMIYNYYSPFFICLLIGIIYLIISIPLFVIFYYIDCGKSDLCELLSKQVELPDIGTLFILLIVLIFYSILYALQHFIKLLTIDSFSVFHLILVVTCGEVINFIFGMINKFDYSDLILTFVTFCFEILGVLVFIERIELNFCGLESNLKKNIIFRERKELKEIYKLQKETENNESDSMISEEESFNSDSSVY